MDKQDAAGKQLGNLAAPRQGERVGAVVGSDAASAQQFKQAMQQVRSMGSGTGMKKKEDEDEDEDVRPGKGKGVPVKGKPGQKPAHAGKAPAKPVAKGRAHKD